MVEYESYNWFIDARARVEGRECQNIPIIDNLSDAYELQRRVIEGLGIVVGGWKLGGTNAKTRRLFDCTSLYYGPIDKSKTLVSKSGEVFSFIADEPLKGEIELAFRVGSAVLPLMPLKNPKEVLKHVDAWTISVECPQTFFFQGGYDRLEYLVADLCGSGFLLLGPPHIIIDFDFDLASRFELNVGADVIASGTTACLLGGVINVLFEFFNLAIRNNILLEEGQWISTGGCSECVPLPQDSMLTLKMDSELVMQFLYSVPK